MSVPVGKIMELIEDRKAPKGLAEYLGIGEHNIALWKSGDSKTYILHMKKIAEYFDVPTDFLFGQNRK